jgi:hypothetical protein
MSEVLIDPIILIEYFVILYDIGFFHACGRSRTSSHCSRVVTREIFRTIVEDVFYR